MEPDIRNKTVQNAVSSKTNTTYEKLIVFSSELKVLSMLLNHENLRLHLSVAGNGSPAQSLLHSFYDEHAIPYRIKQFTPGTYIEISRPFKSQSIWMPSAGPTRFHMPLQSPQIIREHDETLRGNVQRMLCLQLNNAVKKRVVGTCERPIACLLSGGLDSSLITALVNKYYDGVLETYSIGMPGSEDLKRAKIVANYLKTKHTEITLSKEEFFKAIPDTIQAIESYDTTTVRASIGNYLIGKYISEHSDAKVIFNGDGSDELTGGYLYFLKVPDDLEFDRECRRLLRDIHYFDVLRSDRSISSNGLEPRTPFLDRDFIDYYLSIPIAMRNPVSKYAGIDRIIACEKYLLRQAFYLCEPTLLPAEIIWRPKEAFSDGVSGSGGSWSEIIGSKVSGAETSNNRTNDYELSLQEQNTPSTPEQRYYRVVYDTHFPNTADTIPYFWMPKYIQSEDPSARTLEIYNTRNPGAKAGGREVSLKCRM